MYLCGSRFAGAGRGDEVLCMATESFIVRADALVVTGGGRAHEERSFFAAAAARLVAKLIVSEPLKSIRFLRLR